MPQRNDNAVKAEELFSRVRDILTMQDTEKGIINAMMHETLIHACDYGIKNTDHAFGNLFSQVAYLCRKHNIAQNDITAIQRMRYHSNHAQPLSHKDLLYDARALCIFISAIFQTAVSPDIARLLPASDRHYKGKKKKADNIRCIVKSVDDTTVSIVMDDDSGNLTAVLDCSAEHLLYLHKILRENMQLNLLDCITDETRPEKIIKPRLIVVEPDYLIDISTIAACFIECGHHPLLHIINNLKTREITQPILLGNFASRALDDIINSNSASDYDYKNSLKSFFKDNSLDLCACKDFRRDTFISDAKEQADNIRNAVESLFSLYDRDKAVLEPSFICEKLGIQGRVDLMTTDLQLLIEQKSGQNKHIKYGIPNAFGGFHIESNYVQLLLYNGVLHYNFDAGNNKVDIRLLYSKYPPSSGLLFVPYYQKLFFDAIELRNKIVASSFWAARNGFQGLFEMLRPETLNTNNCSSPTYHQYIYHEHLALTDSLHNLKELEKEYFCRMMTFVIKEQIISKVGTSNGKSFNGADLWNMPLNEKRSSGNIYIGLKITSKECSRYKNVYDMITLSVPENDDDFIPNFRNGDTVYIYSYCKGNTPDVRNAILFKGNIAEIQTEKVAVHLTNGMQNPDIIEQTMLCEDSKQAQTLFAIEHCNSSAGSFSISSLYEFITSQPRRKALLLGQREPEKDVSATLSRSYNAAYDDIILHAKQAKDYFLLVGPPGTGKTSMALRFMVEEELTSEHASLLLMAYTNRAVDEICGMLSDAGLDYIRIGGEYNCASQYRERLMQRAAEDCTDISDIRNMIESANIIVGTTSMITARKQIFALKHFTLAIVDEASQILEPNIVGLLASSEKSGCITAAENSIDKFILIGDYKQLPAVVQQNERDSAVNSKLLKDICLDNCRNSLFERLINIERKAGRKDFIGILRTQGRMHPEIAAFANRQFYLNEKIEPVPLPHQTETFIYPDVTDALTPLATHLCAHRLVFVPSQFCRKKGMSEKVNTDEARIVAELLRNIHDMAGHTFDARKTVGVIVPYRNQIAMIRKEIEKLGIPALCDISIDTVERYQGSQRDVIIYSFTVQNRYQLDFLTSNCFMEDNRTIDRKLNVAITRSRKQLIITGNEKILSHNPTFRSLIDFIKEKGGQTDCLTTMK